MLAALLNIPTSTTDWAIWSLNHRDQHDIIRLAIRQQFNINLNNYPIDPIPFTKDGFQNWLENNQQMHDDFDSVLGLQASDLESVDITNRRQLEAWLFLHFQEHYAAALQLKIS